MTAEAASALGLSVAVLAESTGDAACAVASEVVVGSPLSEGDLRSLAERSEVLTFDHEQVDLIALRALADDGVVIRPGLRTLEMAVDKAHMRASLVQAGIPVPAHVVVDLRPGAASPAVDTIERFGSAHGWPLVLKTARGGYDGKGVWPVGDMEGVAAVVAGVDGTLLVEEMVPLQAELAVMVARRPTGEMVTWPAVETAQVGGVCREVLVPGRLPSEVVAEARATGPAGGGDLGGGGRAGGGALLGPGVAAGQRDRRPAPQLGPLDDGGVGHLPVREPPAGRPGPAPRADGAPARGRWPA